MKKKYRSREFNMGITRNIVNGLRTKKTISKLI